jgi:RsiW-degrading membrane proteinase PrsW (M82 family)
MFAIIENFLYLFVYVPDPPLWLVLWRWTVCVALHVGCTLIAGFGAAKVWQKQVSQMRRVPVPVDMRYLVAAILVHGVYNGSVTILELSGTF